MTGPEYLRSRRQTLRLAQNPDGGWGYRTGGQSWLEPTCYALLALHGDPDSAEAGDKGWKLVRSWQNPEGSWRPAAQVDSPSWATSLCLTLSVVKAGLDTQFQNGLTWLMKLSGNEGSLAERLYNMVRPLPGEYDRRYRGWPWRPDTVSWVEPTSHALVALKSALPHMAPPAARKARERIQDGERMLLDRRTSDGGWNHGSRRVLKTDLPAYPESTGIALLGLQDCPGFDPAPALDIAERYWRETSSPLAKAWLAVALRNWGRALPEPAPAPPSQDLMITALEALSYPNGGHQWLKPTPLSVPAS